MAARFLWVEISRAPRIQVFALLAAVTTMLMMAANPTFLNRCDVMLISNPQHIGLVIAALKPFVRRWPFIGPFRIAIRRYRPARCTIRSRGASSQVR